MGEYSATATALAYSQSWSLAPQADPIAHLAPPEGGHAIGRFQFVPFSCLVKCNVEWDAGIERLVYLQSFIEEEIEQLE